MISCLDYSYIYHIIYLYFTVWAL